MMERNQIPHHKEPKDANQDSNHPNLSLIEYP